MFEIVGREEQVLYQWEQGVSLSNPCMKAGDEVVFRNSSGATAVMIARAESGQVVVDVPNKLLQMCCNILVDLEQGKEQHSDCQTTFCVIAEQKPVGYKCVDNSVPDTRISFNDLKDKPFGEETAVLLEEVVEKIGGTARALKGYADVKVGDTVKVTYDGVEYLLEAYERSNGCAFGNKGLAIKGEDTGEPFAVLCIYSASVSQVRVISTEVGKTFNIKIEKVVTQKFDPKYLPDGYPYEESAVLFDQRVEFVGGDYEHSKLLPISAGDAVSVTFDGERYECVAVDASAMMPGAVLIGNLPDLTGEDTGKPFFIAIVPGMGTSIGLTYYDGDGAATSSADIRIEKSVVQTIDPKFLPGGGGGVVIVQDSAMASGVMPVGGAAPTATMNAAEIAEAVFSGKSVYFLEPNDGILFPFTAGFRFGELASGVMTAVSAPDPYALFGAATEDGWYGGVKVWLDGSYNDFNYALTSR